MMIKFNNVSCIVSLAQFELRRGKDNKRSIQMYLVMCE